MRERLRKLLIFVLSIIFIGSTGIVGYKCYSSWKNKQEVDKIKNIVNTVKDSNLHKTKQDYINDGINIVQKINNEYNTDKFSAYLVVGNDKITEPVVHATKPDEYLRTDIHGNYNVAGTVKMYYQNTSYEDDVVSLYGHSMHDNTRFGYLVSLEDVMLENNLDTVKLYSNKGLYEYKLVDMRVIDNNKYFSPDKITSIKGLREIQSVPTLKLIKKGEIKDGHKYLSMLTCHGPATERSIVTYELVRVNGEDVQMFK